MNKELIKSISKMIANGTRLELPKDDHFDNYAQVKKCLLTTGGKYKKCGFEFGEDAQAVKDRLVGGEAIDDKKKYQFFATPTELAEMMVDMANVTKVDHVLEPSAGQGAIADVICKNTSHADITLVELMPQNVKALERKGYEVIEADFLTLKDEDDFGIFDVIIANPPFTKNQDIDHIRHMFSLLNEGGTIVSLASKSWTFGQQKKQVAFREWLDEIGAEITEVPAGAFKESGTNIAAVIIQIEK